MEGGSKRIAHIRVIPVLPVADNWIDEDDSAGIYFRRQILTSKVDSRTG